MNEEQLDDDALDLPTGQAAPDWARLIAERMLGNNETNIAEAREKINARVLADLQKSAATIRAQVEGLMDEHADRSSLVAAAKAALSAQLRLAVEQNRRVVDSLATSSSATASVSMNVVLPRLEAHFEMSTEGRVPAEPNVPILSLPPLTQGEWLAAVIALGELYGFLKNLRESDLADYGVLLWVVAAMVVLVACGTPPEDS